MNGQLILLSFCLGGAALAAWLFVRFPSAGPERLPALIGSVLAVGVGLSGAGWIFEKVANLGGWGVATALMLVVLPALTLSFWISACVMRTFAALPGLRR